MIFFILFQQKIYDCIFQSKLFQLKQADITPVHKKNDTNDKHSYRPVIILPCLSQAFEKCLYDQIYVYTDSILSKT